MNEELRSEYAYHRDWQRKCAADDCYGLTVYPSGRTEKSFGGACYGEHAAAALQAARSMVSFRRRHRRSNRDFCRDCGGYIGSEPRDGRCSCPMSL